jgi:hypothetical protein
MPFRLSVRTPNATVDARVQLKQIPHMYAGLFQLFPSWMPACSCFDLHCGCKSALSRVCVLFGMAVCAVVDILVRFARWVAPSAGTKTKASSTRPSSLAKRRWSSGSRCWAKSTPTLRRATTTSALCEWLVPILLLFGLTVYLLLILRMQTRVRDTCLFRHVACAHHALAWLVPFRPHCFDLWLLSLPIPSRTLLHDMRSIRKGHVPVARTCFCLC